MTDTSSIEPSEATADQTSTAAFDLDAALRRALRGGSANISTHLNVLDRDIEIGQTKTRLHCYFLPVDGNGRVRLKPLAEFLRDQIIDYAIPRKTVEEAWAQADATRSMAPISRLHERAKQLFTHLAITGEGGELLLFAMAEAIFGLTQLLCKMTLKTSTSMHYHGSDGVYAQARRDGGLDIYWGESKIYTDAATAIRNCLESLSPFLTELDGEDAQRTQDILLVNEFANFSDQRLVDGLKRFLDRDDPNSLRLHHCGVALTAFDSSSYPNPDAEATADSIATAIRGELNGWASAVERRIKHERLDRFDIHFICLPLPSAEDFRKYFLELLGVHHDA